VQQFYHATEIGIM